MLAYNSILAIVVDFCLCFLWQDNNAVLANTTAYSVHRVEDRIPRERRRPKASSTNAKQAWDVFDGQSKKWLAIPQPINDYNFGMNGVDTGSQLRGGFSCHKPYDRRWWRPIFYWLIDIVANNAYLIWKTTQNSKNHDLHQSFQDELIHEMLHYDPHTPAPRDERQHQVGHADKKRECAWGKKRPGGCVQGGDKKGGRRRPLGPISGNARATPRPRQVRTGCQRRQVALCIDTGCWENYHALNSTT